jgi:RimJ/RimL family protein N-acetyltransferase
MAGRGLALVAEKDGKLAGILIGMIDSLIWDPDTRVLREIVYWVDEEYRGSTAGYRLLAQYVKECDEMVDSGRITAYSMVKMVNSPDLKFEKFGFKKTEEVWVAGV